MLSSDELLLFHSHICQALSDPKRIQLLYALHAQPLHVNALAELLQIPQSTISRHLSVLRERGLVATERSGTIIVYRLAHPEIITALDIMRGIMRTTVAGRANLLNE
jgi:DNA-binding transcriptional ArsR family regulator